MCKGKESVESKECKGRTNSNSPTGSNETARKSRDVDSMQVYEGQGVCCRLTDYWDE